jgi:hypothetical protein
MNNNAEILDGWAMPDDLAKKVSKAQNNNPISPEDELADALEDMARDIALIEPDPRDWGGWVIHLLEKLGVEAKKRGKQADFERMVRLLL